MVGSEAVAAALRHEGPDAARVLTVLAEEARPHSAHFGAYTASILEFLDSAPAPVHANLAVSALSALIERTEFTSPEPLLEVAPLVLPHMIHALAVVPRIASLAPALETLWLANRSETEQALRQWGLVSRDTALRLAALNQLKGWVAGLNGRFAFRKFTPLVVSLLRDSSEEVRESSYELIVKFFASASPRAREDLAEIMRKQQISEPTRDKIMSAISRELDHDEQKPASTQSGPASRSASASPMLSRTPTPQEPAVLDIDLDIDILRDASYTMQPLEAANIFSEDELLSEISSRLSCFDGKETEWNWSQRQDTVQRFRQMLRCKYVTISPATLRSAVKMLHKPFTDALLSLRTTLVGFTCQAVKDVAQLLPPHMISDLLDPLLEPLSHVASGIKKITASAAHVCICAMLIQSPSLSVRQFQTIKLVSQSKKPHARTYALYWLRAALITSPQPLTHTEDRASDIEQIASKGVTDAVHTARERGRQLYWVIYQLCPELARRIVAHLPASAVKTLQASKPKAKKVVAEPASIGGSESSRSAGPTPSPSDQPAGLGIVGAAKPVEGGATQSTPKGPRVLRANDDSSASYQTAATREASLGISDSIADLSIRDARPHGGFDLNDQCAVKKAVTEHGALSVLRRLAISNPNATTSSMVLQTVRDQAAEVSSAADIAKLIQTDLNGASMSQRLGYLQLLERLNYEQDTVEIVRPATSPAPSSIRRMRPRPSQLALYVDSESSATGSSPRSPRSHSSLPASPSSSLTSPNASDLSMEKAVRRIKVGSSEVFDATTISPFPSTEPACKTYIESLIHQIEQQSAKPEIVAALAVLVTASARPHSRNSPLYAAVDVWHRSYTFDMHLRDVILRYLSTRTDVPSALVALVLLRALLVTPTQAPASAYLEPLACVQTLLLVLERHGGKSLEIDEHALPAARDVVMQTGRSFGSRSLLELLASSYERAEAANAKAFILQTLEQAIANTRLLIDEGAGVLPLVMRALDDGDARVRKEAYPIIVAIHRQNELLGAHAQSRMQAGQRRLLQHYLEMNLD